MIQFHGKTILSMEFKSIIKSHDLNLWQFYQWNSNLISKAYGLNPCQFIYQKPNSHWQHHQKPNFHWQRQNPIHIGNIIKNPILIDNIKSPILIGNIKSLILIGNI